MVETHKYTGKGGYTTSSFGKYNVPQALLPLLVSTSNASLATYTWDKYGNIHSLLRKVESFFETRLSFPFTDSSTLLFCCYFIMRGCKSETIEANLSSLRIKGTRPPNLRPVVVEQLLQGNKNLKRHDLLASIPLLQHYSQRNGVAMSKGERVMKFKDPGSSSKDLLMTEAPSWEDLSTVPELVDSLMAWQSLDHIIHPSHYGTDVIVWIVKKVFFFLMQNNLVTFLFLAALSCSSQESV